MRRALALLLLAPAGCTDEAPPFVPPSFERADQVAFACMDIVADEGQPLERCDVEEQTSNDLHLLALVTQSQRGELALVDLSANEILDVDPSVPGYTFHPVGELPTGVTVSPDGTRAYVASAGARTISIFDVGTIATPAGRLDPIDLGDHVPLDIVADDGHLFVTVPDEGALLVIDSESGEITTTLALEASGTGGGGGADAGPDGDAGAADGGADADAGAADGGADAGGGDGGAPGLLASRPWRMRLDADARRLYVANAGRNGISVVDADAFVELEALPAGVPTSSLAVSPAREHGTGPRFLYAVEAEEGGVRVIDLDSGDLVAVNEDTYERPGGGEVSYADPKHPGPAIRVPAIARSVEFFARGSEGDPVPDVLDGVFAAVVSSDGLLYVVDVEDDRRDDRESNPDEPLYQFLPHHLRSLRPFDAADMPRLSGNAAVAVASSQVICSADYGFIAHFRAPAGPPTCEDAGAGILVDDQNPWIATDETWTVTYEGTIPGTARPRADLEGDHEVIDTVANFCALGVQPDDFFVLESPAQPATPDTDCGETTAERRWRIAEVYANHLVLEEPFGFDPAACGLDGWVSYRIRASDEWTVVGTTTGFAHRVIQDEAGQCVIDEEADTRLNGRAPQCASADDEDCKFENATLEFWMDPGIASDRVVPIDDDTSWTFTTTGALVPLSIAVGGLPATVRYLPGIDRLIAIDPIESGLVEISLTSLAVERSFR